MSVEVLLLSDVPSLGQAGATVHVAPGYARNYLLPKGLAGPVTQATLRRLEKLRKEREELARLQLAEAKDKAKKIKDANVTVRAKTSDGTNLYGSVRVEDIVAALGAQGIDVDRSQIELAAPIESVGQFDVPVKLHPEVSLTVKVWVVEA
ncbi:MAG: 50S ribosomal protein L9 [Kiritimatiellae bacterium]|nr:50S ribosomal protein L9 [Kiritimatiellia bacterium]